MNPQQRTEATRRQYLGLVRTSVVVRRITSHRTAEVALPNGKIVCGFIEPAEGEEAPLLEEGAALPAEMVVPDFSRARLLAAAR